MNSADKNHTTPNFGLVNEADLNKILQFEIFLHSDGQLRAAHVILGYKLISTSFQSPKNVIKAKDPWLHQINVAIPGFLIGPPSEGIHPVALLVQHMAKEEATFSNSTQEGEVVKVIEVVDLEEGFKVFNRPYPIESPGNTSRPLSFAQISNN